MDSNASLTEVKNKQAELDGAGNQAAKQAEIDSLKNAIQQPKPQEPNPQPLPSL